MAAQGIRWRKANKSSGSRQNGWGLMRTRLKQAVTGEGPGLYVCSTCRRFIRTVPSLPRDSRDMDDVDSEAEDHIGDESRYRALTIKHVSSMTQF
jgi:hypothetical protein